MTHDYSLVFDTENPYWQRVLEIFKNNEHYEKKKVSGRNLHHKFPRSFSKKLGEPIDNDKDNLISLSLADHFLVHYYYYLIARKGYRQSMATAFTFMAKKGIKFITPETAEAMAKDYEEAKTIAEQNLHSEEIRQKIIATMNTEESKKKRSLKMKGKNVGEKNGMYGKTTAMKGHSCTDWMSQEEIIKWKEAISKGNKGRIKSTEECKKLSDSHKGNNNPMYYKFQWKCDNKFNTIDMPDFTYNDLKGYREFFHWIYPFYRTDKAVINRIQSIMERMYNLNEGE